MNLRSCAWNFDHDLSPKFIRWGADVEEMIIFIDDRWIDWKARLGRPVDDFEFEDMPELERDILGIMEEVRNWTSRNLVEDFTNLSNVRYCKVHLLAKGT